jgi:hypothetical protein
MKSRDDIAHEEMTCNPIFLLQKRWVYPNQECLADYVDGELVDPDTKQPLSEDEILERGWGAAVWQTVTVIATREEGEELGERTKYRYGKGRKNIDWQVYCIPCMGELVMILKEYFDRDKNERCNKNSG